MSWKNIPQIGWSVRDKRELKRAIGLGADVVEIKLERFAESGFALYKFDGRRFRMNRRNAEKLARLAHGIGVQFHLPIEKRIDPSSETGLNTGVLAHHGLISARYEMLEEMLRDYGIGSVLTAHPPVITENGAEIIDPETAIHNSQIFYRRLDDMRLGKGHRTLIGLENMPNIKGPAGILGYLPDHFKRMLYRVRTVGLTIDTGHRRLAKEFKVRNLLALGIPVVNIHFHGNAGRSDPDSWDDDQHALPDENNVTGYQNYITLFQRHRMPVILEISHLERYSDKVLESFLVKLRKELA